MHPRLVSATLSQLAFPWEDNPDSPWEKSHWDNTFVKSKSCLWLLMLFVCLFTTVFLRSGIDKSTEWSTIPACPSLMCFFNKGDTEGTNSSKILCPMFVYVLFDVNLCHD